MSKPDDSLLDEAIRRNVSGTVPPMVEQKLRARLAEFRSRLAQEQPAQAIRGPFWLRPPLWGLGATCAAVVVLGIAAGLLFRPRTSFAETAAAVLQQPWVHVQMTCAGQPRIEQWLSPGHDINASKRADDIRYEDHRLQVFYTYDTQEKVVYRAPIVWRSRAGDYEAMATALRVLLQQERPPDQPLANLGFLGLEGNEIKVLEQSVHKVTEDGRGWLDYRLKVRDPKSAQPIAMWFRVDPLTKLPHFSRIDGTWEGKPASVESRFDYPEKGPIDIYDLGVPRTAKLVDRVPTDDIQRILATLRAGRERMDNYRALFVKRSEGINYMWWVEPPEIMYRKGNKFRRDFGWDNPQTRGVIKRPAEGEDLGKWWRERSTHYSYFPECVVKGSSTFRSNFKSVKDPDGSPHQEIESVSSWEVNNDPGEMYPPESSMRPEFACRPPLGIGDPHQEPLLDLHPAEGPPGCILLTVRHTSAQGRVNEKGIGLPDGQHYWLDPKRDYIVMRSDSSMRGPNGKQNVFESDTVEETARSPQGVWYATRIRRHFPQQEGKPKMNDEIYSLYVDFNVNLPDSLFEPPKPGRIH